MNGPETRAGAWPSPFSPQQATFWLTRRAQVCSKPTLTAVKGPTMRLGLDLSLFQHTTSRVALTAQTSQPALTELNGPTTWAGRWSPSLSSKGAGQVAVNLNSADRTDTGRNRAELPRERGLRELSAPAVDGVVIAQPARGVPAHTDLAIRPRPHSWCCPPAVVLAPAADHPRGCQRATVDVSDTESRECAGRRHVDDLGVSGHRHTEHQSGQNNAEPQARKRRISHRTPCVHPSPALPMPPVTELRVFNRAINVQRHTLRKFT